MEKTETSFQKYHLACENKNQFEYKELKDFFLIGSDPINNMILPPEKISPRHARIERRGEKYLLRDLRSHQGTFLNGAQIIEAYLNEGDQIQIGPTTLTFQVSDTRTRQHPVLTSNNRDWDRQLKQIPSMAKTDFPVLLLGPSGSGKEILSQTIHQLSERRREPFICINCSALSESLIESELFGHTRGSFTGAFQDRKGAFEAARNGTLFLDEIGDLPLPLQAKLLRAIENKEVKPVGSDISIPTNVRIISATHQNLKNRIAKKEFRADLFYRLNVLNITPPRLAARMEDFEKLLYQFAREMKVRFSFNAIEQLKRHKWPGNIRELKNTVSRAAAIFPQTHIQEEHILQILDTSSLELEPLSKSNPHQLLSPLKQAEKDLIIKALSESYGNQRRAAKTIGMPKSTLNDRIRHYKINIRELLMHLEE